MVKKESVFIETYIHGKLLTIDFSGFFVSVLFTFNGIGVALEFYYFSVNP